MTTVGRFATPFLDVTFPTLIEIDVANFSKQATWLVLAVTADSVMLINKKAHERVRIRILF